MRKMNVAAYSGPLFLSILLVTSTPTPRAHAQAPAAGASVAVRMDEAIDSSKDPAGKQYRASVTKAVDTGNGVIIPRGAAAAVTLVNSGSGWTTRLVSVTINGQTVAVASGPASVTSGLQRAASSAMNSVGSMLGGFGHHVNAHSGATATAMGQRVVLPPGTTLTFVLSQPPAANPAAPAAPAGQPMTASAAPEHPAAAAPTAPASASTASSTGPSFISCSTAAGAGIDTYFTGVFQTSLPIKSMPNGWHFVDQSILDHFYAYLTQKGYKFKPGKNSGCDVNWTEAEAKAAQHTRAYGGGGGLGENCCGNGKIVETGWKE